LPWIIYDILGLFIDTFNSSDNTVSNDMIFNKQWVEKNGEGSGLGENSGINPALMGRD
jgi:hypothetical protein